MERFEQGPFEKFNVLKDQMGLRFQEICLDYMKKNDPEYLIREYGADCELDEEGYIKGHNVKPSQFVLDVHREAIVTEAQKEIAE